MATNGSSSEKMSLSVLLFDAAMQRGQSLSDFAGELGVGPISLRQFILGKTQRPRQKTLDLIGNMLNMPVEEVRRRMDLLPEAAPNFGEWLQSLMEGRYSRARLTRETKISDGALRNYLSGQTLPDSDQAQRLAEVLDIIPLDIARVIVANQVAENGGAVAQPDADQADGVLNQHVAGNGTTAAIAPVGAYDLAQSAAAFHAPARSSSYDEEQVLSLWGRLHPQGRRATLHYIAALLAEG